MKALGTLLGLIGMAGMGLAVWALVKGGLTWASIPSRKVAAAVLAGSFAVVGVGGSIAPSEDKVEVETVEGPSSSTIAADAGTTSTTAATATSSSAPAATATTAESATTATRAKPATTMTTAPRAATTTTRPPTTTTTRPPTTTTSSPAAGSCTASVDNPSPNAGGNVTVTVVSNVPNSGFTATAHYKSKDTMLSGTTDGAGTGSVTFDTGRPTPGYTVKVDVSFSGNATCRTEFTPY